MGQCITKEHWEVGRLYKESEDPLCYEQVTRFRVDSQLVIEEHLAFGQFIYCVTLINHCLLTD